MKREVLLVLPILLLVDLYNCQSPGDIGSRCQRNEDCHSYLACSHNVCTACVKPGIVCIPGATGFLSKCCDGTTCELIPGLNGTSQCMPNSNNCQTNADCSYPYSCLFRFDKCGLCHPNGERCTLPYDSLECCSSYCRIGLNPDGSGMCADPQEYSVVQTTTNGKYNRNIVVSDVNKDITITNNTLYESWMSSIYRNDNNFTTATTTEKIESWIPSIYSRDTNTTTTTETPRPCSDGSQCGINMCINNMCTKCQYINTFCEKSDDCCKSKHTSIVCAVANHKQHIVGYHIYNKKICTLEYD